MPHQTIFTEKYLKIKQANFSLDQIADLTRKKEMIAEWIEGLKTGRIAATKETAIQADFLNKFFGEVLGFVYQKDKEVWHLEKEQTTQVGGKYADGALGFFRLAGGKIHSDIRAVIELKDANTDLDRPQNRKDDRRTPVEQAFSYVPKSGGKCQWVIVSNFQEIRLYHASDLSRYEKFEIAQLLDESQLTRFFFLLKKDRLIFESQDSFLDRLYKENQEAEQAISKKFYEDYKKTRIELFTHIKENNPDYDEIFLLSKTQKIIDRFIFVYFCEDVGLIPPYTFRKILDAAKSTFTMSQTKIWNEVKGLFHSIDKGNPPMDINRFNGGLFAEDQDLDNLIIKDKPIKHLIQLAEYDFESELNVNILGHIFEQSISDIEEIKAEIRGETYDVKKGKRKKEGVYYTPKYITKYIIDNTIGKLCEEKRAEFGIIDEEYTKGRRNRRKLTIKKLDENLQAYREWLLNITICDPACGSGAFLNQALEFLIEEHAYLDDLHAQIFGSSIVFSAVSDHILENNLFGIDINEESAEIAKLSLWLRTAQRGRKLTSLNNNIKCGNSLIDEPQVSGDKAFKWHEEFPAVFAKGGFDVVLGNPPYLRVQGLREHFEKESAYYEERYVSATGRFDIYVLFIERAYGMISSTGKIGFILPHKFMVSEFGKGIRKFLVNNKAVETIVHFGSEMVFEDVSTYTCILIMSKYNKQLAFKEIKPQYLFTSFEFDKMDVETLTDDKWNLQSDAIAKVMAKLKKQKYTLKDLFEWISQGVVSVGDDIFLMQGTINGNKFVGYSEKTGTEIELEADLMKPLLKGEDVKRYAQLEANYYVLYPHYEKAGKTVPYEEDEFKRRFPLAYNYFLPYKEELTKKKIRYKTNPKYWYSLHRSREVSLFEQKEKIITPEISLGTNMAYDTQQLYHNTKCYSLIKKTEIDADYKYLLAILNSPVMWFFLNTTGYVLRGGFFTFKTKYLEPFPVPLIGKDLQQPFIEKVDEIIQRTATLERQQKQFTDLLQNKFDIEKLSKKLQHWYNLNFKEFLKEMEKVKVKLSISTEAEWMSYFNEQQHQVQELKFKINRINKEIDQMVYELYELTVDEIQVVEGSNSSVLQVT